VESTLIISTGNTLLSAIATSVLPDAVGPITIINKGLEESVCINNYKAYEVSKKGSRDHTFKKRKYITSPVISL
jgi:hypothetical protein